MRIAIATCLKLPEPDVDEALLVNALREKGATVRMLPWDDAAQAAEHGETVIVRSTWNYYKHLDEFRAWVARTAKATRLLNPADVIAWNVDKTYLRELEARGVAIVPSAFAPEDVAATMRARGWDHVVIKPVVSAGSFATRRFTLAEAHEAQAFVDGAGRAMMMQPWMPAVEATGERSLVWLAGAFTHAIRKSPRFHGGHESVRSVPIADDERAFAERVLAAVPHGSRDLLYARVDMIRDGEALRLMELELVEPSLFLREHAPALERFANAIIALG